MLALRNGEDPLDYRVWGAPENVRASRPTESYDEGLDDWPSILDVDC
jgi:hypothetical protein